MSENNQVTMSRAEYDIMRTCQETHWALTEELVKEHKAVIKEIQEAGALYRLEPITDFRSRVYYEVVVLDESKATKFLEARIPTLAYVERLETELAKERSKSNPTQIVERTKRWWDFLLQK